jgi:nitroreductase
MEFPTGRRTIHDYSTQPVDEAIVQRALGAAQEAPCHKLTWPWRFTRVGPRGRARLITLNQELKASKRSLTDAQVARIASKMGNPPVLLVVSQVRCDDPMRAQEDYAAVACAIQNLCLSLHVDGVGSKWSSGAVTRHPETYQLVEIDPALEAIVGFIWVGYADCVPDEPARMPLDEVLRHSP